MNTSKQKKDWIYNVTFCLCIILLLLGIALSFFSYNFAKFVWWLYILNFFPAIILLGILLEGVKAKGRKRFIVYIANWILALACLAGAFLVNQFGYIWDSMTAPVSDVTKYAELIKNFDDDVKDIYDHFPKKLSKNAKSVEFYYLPGFLQGGSFLELRMKLPMAEIDNLKRKYQGLGIETFSCDDLNKKTKGKPLEKSFTSNTGGLKDQPLPKSYEIIILGDTTSFPTCNWNHGESYGLAIDKAKSEVIFWANNY